MASIPPLTLREGQLEAHLPLATAGHEVGRSMPYPARVPRVDWAWDELSAHFLCEVKDPEHPLAIEGDPEAAERIRADARESWYAAELAVQAHQTTLNHAPSVRTPKVFVVLLAIEAMTAPELLTASLVTHRELRALGTSATVIAVNIALWNSKFAPRRVRRLP